MQSYTGLASLIEVGEAETNKPKPVNPVAEVNSIVGN